MNRLSVLLLFVLVVLVVLLGVVLYPVLWPSEGRGVALAPRAIPNTDLNPFGANFFLEREVEPWKREETVRMAREAGIEWAKQQFPWYEIEPRQGQFKWQKYDAIVDLCEAYGLQIVARLDSPPNWSRQDNSMPGRPPDDLALYGEFVYQFVERYRGRVRYIQIWNEPNLFVEWGNRPVDPAGYVELLELAYRRAKEADPDVYVLSAPLAITLGEPHPEPGKWRAMNDLQFLDEMYQAGAAPTFDILSANAFGMDLPPEDPPSPGKLNLARVALQREIMERHGDVQKPIWFNEYGWNAAPDSFSPEALVWKRVSEEEQAQYTLRGIEYARQNWPWAGVFFIWYFRQVGDISPDTPVYYFRMVDVDFSPRRVYTAVQDKAAQLSEAGPGYYEETNPAVKVADGAWTAEIDPSASGGAVLVGQAAGSTLTFAFRGGQVDLVTRRGPRGGRLLVTLDGENVDDLSRDDLGRSYVELFAPPGSSEERSHSLLLVKDSSPRRRTLRLTVSDLAHPDATGREAIVDAFRVGHAASAPFPVLPVVLLLIGCVVVGWMLGRSTRGRTGPAGRTGSGGWFGSAGGFGSAGNGRRRRR